ncbi:hypothetical protein ACP70R_045036 [Stipagrostis hirtigluma subsp. patula]
MEQANSSGSNGTNQDNASEEVDQAVNWSLLDGVQLDDTYEDPQGGTLTPVTTKMLLDSCNKFTPDKRPIINGTAATTIRLIGQLVNWQSTDQEIRFSLYDGCGLVDCITWDSEGEHDFHNRIPVVNNYNDITEHFLSCIYTTIDRLKSNRPTPSSLRPDENICSDDRISETSYSTSLAANIIAYIKQLAPRFGISGVPFNDICDNIDASASDISETLHELIDQGDVYTTIDDNHYEAL